MKLELKHLAPYFSHGLTFNTHLLPKLSSLKVTALLIDRIEYYDEDSGHELIEFLDIKPILRPLSDLEKFIHELTDGDEQYNEDLILYFQGVHAIYMTMEKVEILKDFLLKHHFDLFRLIDAGLAIDVNTI